MSTPALNSAYQYAIMALEQAKVGTIPDSTNFIQGLIVPGATTIPIVINAMTNTPFVAGNTYMVTDSSNISSVSGQPNSEQIVVDFISDSTSISNPDGLGWLTHCTLHTTEEIVNNYIVDNKPVVLCPGVEMALQSTDFDCRFKTVTHTPKIDFDDESSRFATGDEGRDLSIAGARSGEINLTEKFSIGSTDPYGINPPKWDKAMISCGHVRNKYGSGIGYEYIPSIYANERTATIWIFAREDSVSQNGMIWRYCGCHGSYSVGASKVGDVIMNTFKFNGAYVATAQIASKYFRVLTSPDTTIPEIMINNTVTVPAIVDDTITTKNVQISSWSLDSATTLNPLIDQGTTTGYSHFVGNDRDPKLTINPYHTSKNLDDLDTLVSTQVTGTCTIETNQTTFEICNGQTLNPAIASREGYINTNRTIRALRNNLGDGATDTDLPDSCMYSVLIGMRE